MKAKKARSAWHAQSLNTEERASLRAFLDAKLARAEISLATSTEKFKAWQMVLAHLVATDPRWEAYSRDVGPRKSPRWVSVQNCARHHIQKHGRAISNRASALESQAAAAALPGGDATESEAGEAGNDPPVAAN